MWSAIFGWVVVLLIVVFVWRFVARLWPQQPAERAGPADEANVLAPLKPRPNLNAGAVALEEPDDEQQ